VSRCYTSNSLYCAAHINGNPVSIVDRLVTTPLRVGDWYVDPVSGQMSKGPEIVKVEARTMRLLLYLAQRTGEVVSIDELLNHVWAGVIVTPDSVYQAITSLRRMLGDDPKRPRYIATVARLGYRMIADVTPGADSPLLLRESAQPLAQPPADLPLPELSTVKSSVTTRTMVLGITGLLLLLLGVIYWVNHVASPAPASIAVLPFLDLTTQEMNEEYFADGLTEELIGDLSKIPAFRVPSPTASFYFKDKQLPIADIARQLGVASILDGSVRKSGNTYRVATRLIRADSGYVVWSEAYDRPLGDLVQVQKDVALEITKAVRASIEVPTRNGR
jgi:transcriptional activator of cad operon